LEGKYTNFEVTPHVLRADILSGRDMYAFEKQTRVGIIFSRDGEKGSGQKFKFTEWI